jgi:flagellar basal-body rod modification protein FlgD
MGIISPLGVDSRGDPKATGSMQILGKNDFLQLLVTQLRYQDPLEPMKDEDFVAQLAQFSSLEQLSNLNENQQQALDWDYLQMQTINNTMATSLIGKDVKANYNTVYLDQDNLPQISFSTGVYAQEIKIQITDSDGTVIRTLTQEDVTPGSHAVEWDGRNENGDRAAEDFYYISISGTDGSGESFTPSTFLEGRVTGVVYRDGSAYLKVNGVEIPLSAVSSIDEPTSQ